MACVILEPTGAAWGAVPLAPERVAAIAAAARAHGTLVVFDEVVTGFRWSPGGAQALIGVTPDLTALAKVVAGGMPGGALAGRADVMDVLAFRAGRRPRSSTRARTTRTRSSAVAGIATLDLLADGSGLARADAVAAELRDGALRRLRAALDARATRTASRRRSASSSASARDDPVTLKRGVPAPLASALQCAMLLEGVHLFHGCGLLSIAHGAAEVELTARAFARALERLQDEGLIP